jgi:hypothetical protein
MKYFKMQLVSFRIAHLRQEILLNTKDFSPSGWRSRTGIPSTSFASVEMTTIKKIWGKEYSLKYIQDKPQ